MDGRDHASSHVPSYHYPTQGVQQSTPSSSTLRAELSLEIPKNISRSSTSHVEEYRAFNETYHPRPQPVPTAAPDNAAPVHSFMQPAPSSYSSHGGHERTTSDPSQHCYSNRKASSGPSTDSRSSEYARNSSHRSSIEDDMQANAINLLASMSKVNSVSPDIREYVHDEYLRDDARRTSQTSAYTNNTINANSSSGTRTDRVTLPMPIPANANRDFVESSRRDDQMRPPPRPVQMQHRSQEQSNRNEDEHEQRPRTHVRLPSISVELSRAHYQVEPTQYRDTALTHERRSTRSASDVAEGESEYMRVNYLNASTGTEEHTRVATPNAVSHRLAAQIRAPAPYAPLQATMLPSTANGFPWDASSRRYSMATQAPSNGPTATRLRLHLPTPAPPATSYWSDRSETTLPAPAGSNVLPSPPASPPDNNIPLDKAAPFDFECWLDPNCNTKENARKCVSHFFGRNKTQTKRIEQGWWLWTCRKHYQRKKYQTGKDKTFTTWQYTQLMAQMDVFEKHMENIEWEIKWHNGLEKEVHDYQRGHGELFMLVQRQAYREPPTQEKIDKLTCALHLDHLCGKHKSSRDVKQFMYLMSKYVRQAEMKEHPDVEFLPSGWTRVEKSVTASPRSGARARASPAKSTARSRAAARRQ